MNQYPYAPSGWQAPQQYQAPPQPQEPWRALPVQFTGSTSEYFRIWIVNTLLSIVTLGIYSAWAKVRRKQYFYRHTWIDGTSFDYLADPIKVLKGRLVIGAIIAALGVSQQYSPVLYVVLLLLLVLASPWLVVKALSFNARNSAFRNIRFAFAGRTGEAGRHCRSASADRGRVMNGARWLVEALVAEGVDTLFGYPGFAMLLFIAAASGGAWLAITIIKTDRPKRARG
jgi:uncharacterized membrane protein YjgN (DUF898 family)